MIGARQEPGPGIRAAVVGAGLMGRWHASELARGGGRLVAAVDPDRHAAERLAARHRGARPERELGRALAEAAPEVVHLCTPTETHLTLLEEALSAGVHVLVEKPLAADASEVERAHRLAEERGLLLAPVHQYPFQRGLMRVEALLGSLQPLLHLELTACSAGGRYGSLDRIAGEILPHPLSVLERLLPGRVAGAEWAGLRPREGELRASATADGVTLLVQVSMNGRPPRNELTVIGGGGTAHVDFFHGYAVLERARASRAQKVLQPFSLGALRLGAAGANLGRRTLSWEPAYPGLRTLIRRFYAAVREGGPPPISAEESLTAAEARDAILASADSRRS